VPATEVGGWGSLLHNWRNNFISVLALYNTGSSHRWSDGNDKDGTTLCVEWNAASQATVIWNGWTFVPTNIQGPDTGANILAACQAAGLETPCDSEANSDGKCQTVWTGKLSLSSHDGFPLSANKFFYAGAGMAMGNPGDTQKKNRLATSANANGQTLCVKTNPLMSAAQTWNGWTFTPVQFTGTANSANLLAACRSPNPPPFLQSPSPLAEPHRAPPPLPTLFPAGRQGCRRLAIIKITTTATASPCSQVCA